MAPERERESEEEEGWEVKKEKESPRISIDRRLWDCRVASYDAPTLLWVRATRLRAKDIKRKKVDEREGRRG